LVVEWRTTYLHSATRVLCVCVCVQLCVYHSTHDQAITAYKQSKSPSIVSAYARVWVRSINQLAAHAYNADYLVNTLRPRQYVLHDSALAAEACLWLCLGGATGMLDRAVDTSEV
jgi:hypothetical protein